MTGVDLTSADLRGADFTRADLRSAVLTDVCFDRTTRGLQCASIGFLLLTELGHRGPRSVTRLPAFLARSMGQDGCSRSVRRPPAGHP
jgi:hypothetical protein